MNDRLEEDSIPFCQGPNPDPGMPIHQPPPEAWDCHAHIFAGHVLRKGRPGRNQLEVAMLSVHRRNMILQIKPQPF
jgi:hypothetical protein